MTNCFLFDCKQNNKAKKVKAQSKTKKPSFEVIPPILAKKNLYKKLVDCYLSTVIVK